jgi:WS/DGAT/MGAT family acyltransferase
VPEVVPVERLSVDDQVMLWPDALWPQEIGAVVVLDGSLLDRNGQVRMGLVQGVVESRLHLVPRLRQVLLTPGPGLGGPLWTDAPQFDIAEHVMVVPVPPPGDEAALLRTVERLRRQRLDRSRPLWQLCLLPGLAGRRVGLFVRLHHALADGLAGIATIGVFLDAVPYGHSVPVGAVAWRPAAAPSRWELFADNVHRRTGRAARALSVLHQPGTVRRAIRAAGSSVRGLVGGDPEPPTSLNRVIGNDRAWALLNMPLDDVTRIAHAHRATVNDVLLTLTGRGLRALLAARGELHDDAQIRVDVPVTLRPATRHDLARGNLVSQMMIPLPVEIAEPDRRLAAIAACTTIAKATDHPPVGVLLHGRFARWAVLKLLRRHPVNVTTADLIGPDRPAYLAGSRVLEVYPVLPLMANVSLGVGAVSYAGRFFVTVVADRDAYPDLDVFVAGLREEWAALRDAASVSPLRR